MNAQRTLKIIREGGEQRISIPADMQFPGDEVLVRKVGDRLFVEPVPAKPRKTLVELLDEWEPIDEEFPEIPDPPPYERVTLLQVLDQLEDLDEDVPDAEDPPPENFKL